MTIKNSERKKILVEFPYRMSFDDVYEWFRQKLSSYNEDVILYGRFNDVYVDSDMSEDELWIAHCGRTKSEDEEFWEQERKKTEEYIKKSAAETERIIAEHDKWIVDNYGCKENYYEAITDEYWNRGLNFIRPDKTIRWREFVSANVSSHIDKIEEIIHYLKSIKKSDNPESIFSELKEYMNNQDHSGSTAHVVLHAVEEFGGEPGIKFYEFMTGKKSKYNKI